MEKLLGNSDRAITPLRLESQASNLENTLNGPSTAQLTIRQQEQMKQLQQTKTTRSGFNGQVTNAEMSETLYKLPENNDSICVKQFNHMRKLSHDRGSRNQRQEKSPQEIKTYSSIDESLEPLSDRLKLMDPILTRSSRGSYDASIKKKQEEEKDL